MAPTLWQRRRARAADPQVTSPLITPPSSGSVGFCGSNVPTEFPFSPPIAFRPQVPYWRVRRTQLTDILAPFSIIARIAANLQIKDLHNLALTSQAAYDHIGSRLQALRDFKQMVECKGRGPNWGRDPDIPWIYGYADYVPDEFNCTGTGKRACETCNATICDGCRFKAQDTNAFYKLPSTSTGAPWTFSTNHTVLFREIHYVWVCSDCVAAEPLVGVDRWAECDCGDDISYYWWRYHVRPSCYGCRVQALAKRSTRAQALWQKRDDVRRNLRDQARFPLPKSCACGRVVGERNFLVLCPCCRKRVRRIVPRPPQHRRPLPLWDWQTFWTPPPAMVTVPEIVREFKGKVVRVMYRLRDGWRRVTTGEHW